MKKAFTLIELLVVIGIIAVLMGVLLASVAGGTESARAARCLTNMRSLATACNSRAVSAGSYPLAGSCEVRSINLNGGGGSDSGSTYQEARGWLSWNSRDAYNGTVRSHVSNAGWLTSAYNDDYEVRQFALTNGVLWSCVSGNSDIFVCPTHRRAMKNKPPIWSYVMNQRFGYDDSHGARAKIHWPGIEYGKLARADRTLMFAELQFLRNDRLETRVDPSSGPDLDCTLEYSRNEVIGVNHVNGKRGLFAHVVFADGHIEKITVPARPSADGWSIQVGRGELEDLTKWLCQGKDISYNGNRYEKLQD